MEKFGEGYEMLDRFNEMITDIERDHPINEKTARNWVVFTRGLKTSLDIIEDIAKGYQIKSNDVKKLNRR